MSKDRIVSVGFLSEHDLAVLGKDFTRHFLVKEEDMFADLLAQLDKVEAVPLDNGVALVPSKQP